MRQGWVLNQVPWGKVSPESIEVGPSLVAADVRLHAAFPSCKNSPLWLTMMMMKSEGKMTRVEW